MEVSQNTEIQVIEPPSGWQFVDWRELLQYRDLLVFLVKRDIQVLYAQTVLGFSWAILNPLIQIVIFSIIFGRVAKLDTGDIPYVLFSTVAVIPWTYMSEAMSTSSQSLVRDSSMMGKVYFPRILYPLTPIVAKLLDFSISLVLVIGVMIYYGVEPTANLLFLPALIVFMIAVPSAIGLWLSSLAIRFRDVKFAMPFVIRMLIYSAPVLYSVANLEGAARFFYSLNPIVGVIAGFRACLLGSPMPWADMWPGALTTAVLLFTGLLYFRRMEKVVVDVI